MSKARKFEDVTDEEWAALQSELDELERTDPAVAAAAASYDRMVRDILKRPLPSPNTETRTQQ